MCISKINITVISFFCYLLYINTSGYGQNTTADLLKNNSIQKNLGIAQFLIENNQEDSALMYLNVVLAKKYNHQEALTSRAKIYNNKRFFDKALIDYNALAILAPENKEIVYARGIIRQELSQYELAIEDYQQALMLPNGETQTAFFKMEQGGNMTSGIATLSTMEADIWNNIGQCYSGLGEYANAIDAFNKGIEVDNAALDIYVNRAIAYEKNANFQAAISDYTLVLSQLPDHPVASFNLLNLEKYNAPDADHINALNIFIVENPSNSEGYELRGLHYFETKKYDLALKDFQEASRINPENINIQFNLALTFARSNNLHDAETIFLQIIETDPGHSGAYFNLGNLLFRKSQYKDAISYFTLAHQLNPANKLILYNRALAYFESGQKQMACTDMQTVMKADKELANSFYTKYCNE